MNIENLNAEDVKKHSASVREKGVIGMARMQGAFKNIHSAALEGEDHALIEVSIGQHEQFKAIKRELESRGFRVGDWNDKTSLVYVYW